MKHEISAGAVVYAYKHTTCYYLLLLYESGYWGFVKGKSESGETLEQTAVREIAEETGLSVNLDTSISHDITYIYTNPHGEKVHKIVHLFVAKVPQKIADLPVVTLSHEHRGYGWFTHREALAMLTHEASRSAFSDIQQRLQA
ncbi:MAG: NUDIX hydrolase [candidate division TM6 bacterium GW2011_GWE2_41_16]|nr:MAG: NUDIX hydrolase [candidate division TM6 bacterium GW2011_GWE2_41_16]